VVIAERQTRGRGRAGRAWLSTDGGLYLSIVLRPPLPPQSAPPLTLAIGLGIADAMDRLGARVRLKWPNDVLAEDRGERRKLAGVLTEMSTSGSKIEHLVVGIGLNLSAEVLPPEIAEIATSLRRVTGLAHERPAVIEALLAALERRYRAFVEGGALATVVAFRQRVDYIGRRVSVSNGEERVEGVAEAIDDEGALIVRDERGAHRLWAGDVALIAVG
jgi:BirA family biotin operon repressor/biotin-[acetyl-CoA-carboxylase] ligase